MLTRIGALEQTVGPAKKRWGEYLAGLEDSERSRAEECRQLRLSRRVAWAKGGSGGQWV